jgi:hypothetical protein
MGCEAVIPGPIAIESWPIPGGYATVCMGRLYLIPDKPENFMSVCISLPNWGKGPLWAARQ